VAEKQPKRFHRAASKGDLPHGTLFWEGRGIQGACSVRREVDLSYFEKGRKGIPGKIVNGYIHFDAVSASDTETVKAAWQQVLPFERGGGAHRW